MAHCYKSDASFKKVNLQYIHKQYKNLNMKNNDKIQDFISRVILITNEMKSCGNILSEQVLIEKVLRSFTTQLDYIIVEIEHSNDLSTMKIEDLIEAQEFRLTERTSKREVEKALKASSGKKI